MHLDGVRFCLFALQMLMVQNVVADINRQTGESECQYYKDRLLYTEDGQRDELIDRSRTLSCHGELKNNRGLVSKFLQFHYTPPPCPKPFYPHVFYSPSSVLDTVLLLNSCGL